MVAAFSFQFGVETVTFFLAAFICVGGALGVVMSRNPVHSALSLAVSYTHLTLPTKRIV